MDQLLRLLRSNQPSTAWAASKSIQRPTLKTLLLVLDMQFRKSHEALWQKMKSPGRSDTFRESLLRAWCCSAVGISKHKIKKFRAQVPLHSAEGPANKCFSLHGMQELGALWESPLWYLCGLQQNCLELLGQDHRVSQQAWPRPPSTASALASQRAAIFPAL